MINPLNVFQVYKIKLPDSNKRSYPVYYDIENN
jgi:hypothetical protein